MKVWKMFLLFNWVMFRFHVSFPGCIPIINVEGSVILSYCHMSPRFWAPNMVKNGGFRWNLGKHVALVPSHYSRGCVYIYTPNSCRAQKFVLIYRVSHATAPSFTRTRKGSLWKWSNLMQFYLPQADFPSFDIHIILHQNMGSQISNLSSIPDVSNWSWSWNSPNWIHSHRIYVYIVYFS